MIARTHRRTLAVVVCATTMAPAAGAQAATTRSCGSIDNPYAGTRYEGADITRIQATGARCSTARRVARGSHRKALGLTPNESGIRTFSWNGWRVRGDLRGANDTDVATRGSARVRWRSEPPADLSRMTTAAFSRS
jgi:hypothetical protein